MVLEQARSLGEAGVGLQVATNALHVLDALGVRYQAVRIVRSARVQISSLLMHRIYHVGGVERLVRNSVFAGRTPAEHYERLAWLYERPPLRE